MGRISVLACVAALAGASGWARADRAAQPDALEVLVGDWDVDATEVTADGVRRRALRELAVRGGGGRVEVTVREPGGAQPVWQNTFALEAGGPGRAGLTVVEEWRSGARIRHQATFEGGRLIARGRLPDGTDVEWSACRVGARLVYQREDRKNGVVVASAYEVLTPHASAARP